MSIYITIDIGTHQIQARHMSVEETQGKSLTENALEFIFTWHKSIETDDWTFARIEQAAKEAENDNNYIRAEQNFVRLMGWKKAPAYIQS